LVVLWGTGVVASEPVELITYNIRLNTQADGEHAWPNRKEDVAALFRFHRADIFCVQEALPEQVDFLAGAFPGFGYVGVGRTDGEREGEFSAVFYSRDRFENLDGGTYWLSETPGIPGKGWDAAYPRICSWAELRDKNSGVAFFVFNTHFDHVGTEARKNSASLILEKTAEIAGKDRPLVLCGDFNLPPESEPIRMIGQKLKDTYAATEIPPYGSVGTFHGFSYDNEPGRRIDYVFVSEGIRVKRYGVLTDSRDRAFFSDHLPVLVTLEF